MFPSGRSLIIADGGLVSLLACAAAREAALGAVTQGRGHRGVRSPARREGQAAPIAWIPRFRGGAEGPIATDGDAPQGRTASLRAAIRSNHAAAARSLARGIAAERQAALLSLEIVHADVEHNPEGNGPEESHTLLAAARDAMRLGCSSVVWPVQCGFAPGEAAGGLTGNSVRSSPDPDVDAIAKAVDRALLVTRLAALDSEDNGTDLEVATPFVDLSDAQAAELALDMDLAVQTCWWWEPVLEAQGGKADAQRPPEAGRVPACARAEFTRWLGALENVGYFGVTGAAG